MLSSNQRSRGNPGASISPWGHSAAGVNHLEMKDLPSQVLPACHPRQPLPFPKRPFFQRGQHGVYGDAGENQEMTLGIAGQKFISLDTPGPLHHYQTSTLLLATVRRNQKIV